MKKTFSFAAMMISLLFFGVGCSFFTNDTVSVQTNYSLFASVDDCREKSELTIHHTGGDYRIRYQEPDSLAGFEEYYTMDENGQWQIELNYQGLSMSIKDASLLKSSVGNDIVASLQDAQTKNQREISGITEEGSYILKLDSDGYPSKLSIPQQDLTVTFEAEK